MTKLKAIEYLVKNSVYQDEWSGAGMWEQVLKVMEGEVPMNEDELDEMLLQADKF